MVEKATDNRLSGMKEICKHLKRSESTVLGWQRDCSLPIKKNKGRWMATRSQLNKWWDDFCGQS